jgi:1-acyl-sn-glycerol-3-phosphate acyltransferase
MRRVTMKVSFVPPESRRRNILYGFMKILLLCWCKCLYPLEVHGKQYIPRKGLAIIAPKHQYWTDIPLVALAFQNIHLNYIAKKELFRFPLIRTFLTILGGIPLDRKAPIKSLDSFRHLNYLLKRKEKIVVFPEGTYYRGRIGKGKSRLVKMILKFQEEEQLPDPIPFIPVGISYQKMRFRQKVRIRIGEPLYAKGEFEAEEFTQKIMSKIAFLSGLELNS